MSNIIDYTPLPPLSKRIADKVTSPVPMGMAAGVTLTICNQILEVLLKYS